MTILLSDIWAITDPSSYKLHFARRNPSYEPLDVWVRDRAEFQEWQEYRPARDDFNRPYIFAVMSFYHEPGVWLFGGVFAVRERHPDRYVVELLEEGRNFIGRLKLGSTYSDRATRVKFENHYPAFHVREILREAYSGRAFPGFDSIDLSFDELEAIVREGKPDWRAALSSIKGVYLITDVSTQRRYVGSAYGDGGVWGRWTGYVFSGHGGNVELRALTSEPSLDYFRSNFRFTLLEHRSVATADDVIISREGFWKQILLTRGTGGLNRN